MTAPDTEDPARGAPPRRPLVLDSRFLRLWCGATASGLATWSLPFVLGLAVLERELTATALGVVLAARTVGFLLAVPVAGVLADRYSRRAVVLWAGLAAAAASPVIALGLGRSTALMAAAAVVVGAGQGACRPAFQALTAEVVAAADRQRANAAMTMAVRVTSLVAPGATALLAVVAGVWALLIGTGALWLVTGLLPPSGRAGPARVDSRFDFAGDFREGVREARKHPWFLAGLGALTAVIATGYSATGVALPLVSRDDYGSEFVLAAASTGYTAGALAGGLLMSRWKPVRQGWVAMAGLAAYGLAPLSLVLPTAPIVVVAAYVAAGIGIEVFNVPWFTAIQHEVAPDKIARVSSLDFLLSYGLAPLGLVVMAPAIEWCGAPAVLLLCALICFAAPAAAALHPSSRTLSVNGACR
ncbi:MFS transporter [Saccharothrix coeruleofusca]|uniref:MFS transporter n=1 Tax=Saccharothrix coeruleofusca TaxID=33919 RepID=A0A918APP8_9PSEU|nr:MFS transporter [Saccharothrix coeruleofusca]GGP66223.1 MFS transporter [Saccharothrix coeruleofusca]